MEDLADVKSAPVVQHGFLAPDVPGVATSRDSLQKASGVEGNPSHTFTNKLYAECQLLAGEKLINGVEHAIQKINSEKVKTAAETAVGLGIGVALNLLDKNPATKVAFSMKVTKTLLMGAFCFDVGDRLGPPMLDVWHDPATLEASQRKLGDNLGEFVTNLGVSVVGGLAAAKMTEFVAQTRAGAFLQGYSESKLDSTKLDPAFQEFFAKEATSSTDYKLKTFANGTQVVSNGNKVVVSSPEGLDYNFVRSQSLLGFKSSINLNSISERHNPLSGMDGSTDLLIKAGKLSKTAEPFAASNMVANDGATRTFEFANGLKISTDSSRHVKEVFTPFSSLRTTPDNRWSFMSMNELDSPKAVGQSIFSDLGKIIADPMSVGKIAISSVSQMVIRETLTNRALDLGLDKLLHTTVYDPLAAATSTDKR